MHDVISAIHISSGYGLYTGQKIKWLSARFKKENNA
jgi:hypothetical protein